MAESPDDSELRDLLAGRVSRVREREITRLLSDDATLQTRLETLSGVTAFTENFAASESHRELDEEEEELPDHVGKFEILGLIGRGGMGRVYRARDPELDRVVAVKVISTHLSRKGWIVDQFRKEASSIAAIEHPNVLPIYEIGDHEGSPFIVTRLIEGESLSERLVENRDGLPISEVIEIGHAVACALVAAHEVGLVHRDVKPSNILLEKEGEILLADFGLALPVEEENSDVFGNRVAGTPDYMSPEQVEGRAADSRTDLFSLGSVLYQSISGQPPFASTDVKGTLWRVVHDEPDQFFQRANEIPVWLKKLVFSLLEKDPASRPENADSVAGILGVSELFRWLQSRTCKVLAATTAAALIVGIAAFFVEKRNEAYRAANPFESGDGMRFASLSAAIESPHRGEKITIHRGGVIPIQPASWEGDLFIEAAENHTPFLVAPVSDDETPFWQGRGDLSLRGIGLQYDVGKQTPPPLYESADSSLTIQNCRVMMSQYGPNVEPNAPFRPLFHIRSPKRVEVSRSELIGATMTCFHLVDAGRKTTIVDLRENYFYSRLILDLTYSNPDSEGECRITFRNNATHVFNAFMIRSLAKTLTLPKIQFEAASNHFSARNGLINLDTSLINGNGKNVAWSGNDNLHMKTPFLRFSDGRVDQNGFSNSIPEWQHFRRTVEDGSTVGRRYVLKYSKGVANTPDFTPAHLNPHALQMPVLRANLDMKLVGPHGLDHQREDGEE